MAPHLTDQEIDAIFAQHRSGKTTGQVHAWLAARRGSRGLAAPNITNIRKVLRGRTYRRGRVETRGRKRKLSRRAVLRMNSSRKQLIKRADSTEEVHWDDVIAHARVAKVHPSTAARSMSREGIPVAWRAPRERPQREPHHERERMDICRRWRFLPENYFTDRVDMIIDNKKFSIPTYARAVKHLRMTRVRGHLRTRSEGVKKAFTKPNQKRQKVFPGASINVCAAIIGGKVRVWHYLPRSWNGQAATDLYANVLIKALVQHRGRKPKYTVLEDNDPTGYKSNKAKAAKDRLGIEAVAFPRHSPDLNPLDFHVWHAVEQKALRSLRGPTTVKAYKDKLRRIALALPEADVRKAVLAMRSRARAVFAAKGGDIPRD